MVGTKKKMYTGYLRCREEVNSELMSFPQHFAIPRAFFHHPFGKNCTPSCEIDPKSSRQGNGLIYFDFTQHNINQ